MIWRTQLLALFAGLVAFPAWAAAETRILVTFSDPGMNDAAVAGPAGPTYRRTSSSYLVSIGVKRAANRLARDFELELVDEWPILPLKVHCLVYSIADDVAVEALLQRINERPEVESAQLLNEFEVSASSTFDSRDPHVRLQHHVVALQLAEAHSLSRGEGVSITIIDTGADINHPELKSQIRDHADFVDPGHGEFSADAHGTAIAGVIAAAEDNGVGIVGVAPLARLTIFKACWYGDRGSRAICDSFTLAKALSNAAVSDTAIINLSLAGPADPLLARLVTLAIERGIVVVGAAPESGGEGFPAGVPGVLVAGTEDGKGIGRLLAPGDSILAPLPGGGFDFISGSSLSAAQVSGVAALLLAKKSDLRPDEVNRLLVDSPYRDSHWINACRALTKLLNVPECLPARPAM
jgi:hypothetical protein